MRAFFLLLFFFFTTSQLNTLWAIDITTSGNQTICAGNSTANFWVEATTSATPFTYQWEIDNTGGATSTASFENPDMPTTALINIEEDTNIKLTVTDNNGFVCEEYLSAFIASLHFVNADGAILDHIDIGHWGEDVLTNIGCGTTLPETYNNPIPIKQTNDFEDGCVPTTFYFCNPINTETQTFIDLDEDRFFIRLEYKNDDILPIEYLIVGIATLKDSNNISNGYDDDLTEIQLYETAPGSGIFMSKSLLLTTADMFISSFDSDDDLAVYDGYGVLVPDDALGDRTHRVTINGGVEIKYINGEEVDCSEVVPVCDRDPEERKRLKVRAHVFFDPNMSNGPTVLGSITNAENIVNQQIQQANILWAQACIGIDLEGRENKTRGRN